MKTYCFKVYALDDGLLQPLFNGTIDANLWLT